MLERTLLVLLLMAVVLVAAVAIRVAARRRARAAMGARLPAALAERLPGRTAGVIYFYGPHCGTCQQQASILDGLAREAEIAVVRIDAARETALADALAVATVPTTVVVDDTHTVRAINLGFRSSEALSGQLRDLAAPA